MSPFTQTTLECQKVIRFFESLTPQTLSDLPQIYANQAQFKDPFNCVQGVTDVHAIFKHMFATLDCPQFVVKEALSNSNTCFLVWEFSFKIKGKDFLIQGSSHIHFDENRQIIGHRDYWDAAEELYERLPFLGGLMRFLKKKLQAPQVTESIEKYKK